MANPPPDEGNGRRGIDVAFEHHRADVAGYCYRMLGPAFDAEDALQETFVRAWRGFHRFEGRAALRSWLLRIATNVCIDMLSGRARRALPMGLGPSSGDTVSEGSCRRSPGCSPSPTAA